VYNDRQPLTLETVASTIDATLLRPDAIDAPHSLVTGFADILEAGPHQLAFCTDRCHEALLPECRAAAVIVRHPHPNLAIPQLIHSDPIQAFMTLAPRFAPPVSSSRGSHPQALISPTAHIGSGVSIGPFTVVEADAWIGDDVPLDAGCFIAAKVHIGRNSHLQPGVTLLPGTTLGQRVQIQSGTVVGADGFGYRWDGTSHAKIPQLGRVVIEDDVEIGANCTIDRATLGETRVGTGTRLDNLVHVGHNVQIGKHVLLVAQVGLSGSVHLGDGAILAGQVGVADHASIGVGAVVAAKSGVHGRVEAGTTVAGYPHRPIAVWRRVAAALPRLPELLKRVRRLEDAQK